MRVLQSRLQPPRSKQHIAKEALEHQAEIEAETRVEEGGDKPGRNGDQQGRDD